MIFINLIYILLNYTCRGEHVNGQADHLMLKVYQMIQTKILQERKQKQNPMQGHVVYR